MFVKSILVTECDKNMHTLYPEQAMNHSCFISQKSENANKSGFYLAVTCVSMIFINQAVGWE